MVIKSGNFNLMTLLMFLADAVFALPLEKNMVAEVATEQFISDENFHASEDATRFREIVESVDATDKDLTGIGLTTSTPNNLNNSQVLTGMLDVKAQKNYNKNPSRNRLINEPFLLQNSSNEFNGSDEGNINKEHISTQRTDNSVIRQQLNVSEVKPVTTKQAFSAGYLKYVAKVKRLMPSFCNVYTGTTSSTSRMIEIECLVGEKEEFRFKNFRQMTKQFNKTNEIEFSLKIRCKHNGMVSAPFPMRAYLLKVFWLESCTIENYYSEHFTKYVDAIPDTIEDFKMVDTIILLNTQDLYAILTRTSSDITRAAHCGPEIAKSFISQNNTEVFPKDSKEIDIMALSKGYFLNRTQIVQNKIQCKYKHLIVYDMSRSSTIGINHFEDMVQNSYPELRVLNFSHTGFSEMPNEFLNWRLYFPKLDTLDLSHNRISELKFIKDYGLKNETKGVIDLQYNHLSFLPTNALRKFDKHQTFYVDLRNNPLTCECEVKDTKDFLTNDSNPILMPDESYFYLTNLLCQSPMAVKGRTIASLTEEDMGCKNEIPLLLSEPIVALCVLVALLTLTIVIIIKYRTEIVILAFTRMNIILPCKQTDKYENKKYDAFVAYSQEDSAWVIGVLMQKLEQENLNAGDPFNLCLHHRDFEVGMPIAQNIIQSVESSRHTILIVSKHFLKSEWCLMEFRTAFHQSLLERKKHMIIILMEDVPNGDLDNDLKRCLKTLTYVKTDDILFWDKLIYAISDNGKKRRK